MARAERERIQPNYEPTEQDQADIYRGLIVHARRRGGLLAPDGRFVAGDVLVDTSNGTRIEFSSPNLGLDQHVVFDTSDPAQDQPTPGQLGLLDVAPQDLEAYRSAAIAIPQPKYPSRGSFSQLSPDLQPFRAQQLERVAEMSAHAYPGGGSFVALLGHMMLETGLTALTNAWGNVKKHVADAIKS